MSAVTILCSPPHLSHHNLGKIYHWLLDTMNTVSSQYQHSLAQTKDASLQDCTILLLDQTGLREDDYPRGFLRIYATMRWENFCSYQSSVVINQFSCLHICVIFTVLKILDLFSRIQWLVAVAPSSSPAIIHHVFRPTQHNSDILNSTITIHSSPGKWVSTTFWRQIP